MRFGPTKREETGPRCPERRGFQRRNDFPDPVSLGRAKPVEGFGHVIVANAQQRQGALRGFDEAGLIFTDAVEGLQCADPRLDAGRGLGVAAPDGLDAIDEEPREDICAGGHAAIAAKPQGVGKRALGANEHGPIRAFSLEF